MLFHEVNNIRQHRGGKVSPVDSKMIEHLYKTIGYGNISGWHRSSSF
jgi:hypothetical protein